MPLNNIVKQIGGSRFQWFLYQLTGMSIFRYNAYYYRIREVRHPHGPTFDAAGIWRVR